MIRIILIFLSYYNCQALIVPQELPSLLSLVYSTIPQIRKGSDSRYGFGFRLGEHADFQVLLEIGPQIETKQIGKTNDDSGSSLKRDVNQNDYIPNKDEKIRNFKNQKASEWLKQWQKNAKIVQNSKVRPTVKSKAEKLAAIKMIPVINEAALGELLSLYKSIGNQQNDETKNKNGKAIAMNDQNIEVSSINNQSQQKENSSAIEVILT